jgi:hypothetical protein
MDIKIKIIRSIDYLSVADDGSVEFEESKKRLHEIAGVKRPPADFDILLDFRRTQWVLSTEDIFSLAYVLINDPDSHRDKIALLVLPGVNFNLATFKELCSRSTGIDVQTFTNYEDAIHWFYDD